MNTASRSATTLTGFLHRRGCPLTSDSYGSVQEQRSFPSLPANCPPPRLPLRPLRAESARRRGQGKGAERVKFVGRCTGGPRGEDERGPGHPELEPSASTLWLQEREATVRRHPAAAVTPAEAGGDASENGEVSADRASFPSHRPEPRWGAGEDFRRSGAGGLGPSCGAAAGPAAAPAAAAAAPGQAASSSPHRLRDFRRLQSGEHAAFLEQEGDGRRGRNLLPGLDRRAGPADPGQRGALGGAPGGLDAPGAQTPHWIPHPLLGSPWIFGVQNTGSSWMLISQHLSSHRSLVITAVTQVFPRILLWSFLTTC
ncbi:uncharacterized protein [Notamacropus eugenii]|uniref:uncharacterized protein n=1 Tax=Notamacropus eugenii TaxID=9315 RepID=UPI003B6856FE